MENSANYKIVPSLITKGGFDVIDKRTRLKINQKSEMDFRKVEIHNGFIFVGKEIFVFINDKLVSVPNYDKIEQLSYGGSAYLLYSKSNNPDLIDVSKGKIDYILKSTPYQFNSLEEKGNTIYILMIKGDNTFADSSLYDVEKELYIFSGLNYKKIGMFYDCKEKNLFEVCNNIGTTYKRETNIWYDGKILFKKMFQELNI